MEAAKGDGNGDGNGDGDGKQQLPAASKICNIHQSHSTHRWPGMRMSSRAALERSNSFRIRIRIHSIRITIRAGSGSGSGCACGALFLGLGLICLAHFQVNYTYLWHLRHSNIENQCGGSLAWAVGVGRLCLFCCINSSGSCCMCVCVCVGECAACHNKTACVRPLWGWSTEHKWVTLQGSQSGSQSSHISCGTTAQMLTAAFEGPTKG